MLDGARIFHVNVNCSDLERSRRFYVDGLGLSSGARTTPAEVASGAAFELDRARWDAWILVGNKGFDGGAIDLLEWHEPRPAGAPPAALNERGFQRLGVRVPDLGAASRRIVETGGAVWSEPFGHALANGGEIKLVFANDPDGVAIEVIEAGGPALSFVGVTVQDLAQSVAFYAALGFEQRATFSSDNPDASHLRVDGRVAFEEALLTAPGGGDVTLILVEFDAPEAITTPARPANTLGMWRLALVVPDLDRAVETLTVSTLSEPVTMPMGPGLPDLRFVCFRGPDGEVLELIEQPT